MSVFYYDFYRHRIGDKVTNSACLQWFKREHPEAKLIAIDDNVSFGRRLSVFPSSIIFKGIIDECSTTRPANAFGLDFGNVWVRLSWLAKEKGIYPHISVDSEKEAILREHFPWMSGPYVCIHILEDAQYNIPRNIQFEYAQKLITRLAQAGVTVVRVGRYRDRRAEDCIDLSAYKMDLMQTAIVIKNSRCYFGGDTGPTHVAGATEVPHLIVAYYKTKGTDPRSRWYSQIINCGADFSTLPSVPEERLHIIRLNNHAFDVDHAYELAYSAISKYSHTSQIKGIQGNKNSNIIYHMPPNVHFAKGSDSHYVLVGSTLYEVEPKITRLLGQLPSPHAQLVKNNEISEFADRVEKMLEDLCKQGIVTKEINANNTPRHQPDRSESRLTSDQNKAIQMLMEGSERIKKRRMSLQPLFRQNINSKINSEPKIVCVIYGGLGDMVLSTAMLSLLKEHIPDATIDVIVKWKYAHLFERCFPVDRVIKWSGERFWELAGEDFSTGDTIRPLYDIALSCCEHFGGACRWFTGKAICYALNAPIRVGVVDRVSAEYLEITKALLTHPITEQYEHEAKRMLRLLGPLGIPYKDQATRLFVSSDAKAKAQQLCLSGHFEHKAPLLGIAPSTVINKEWSVDKYASLIQALKKNRGVRIVLLGSRKDAKKTAIIRYLAQANTDVLDLTGLTSIDTLVAVIRSLSLLISSDSGPAHIAAALQIPQIVLWGPTNPDRYRPWMNEQARIVRVSSRVMEDISVSQVVQLANDLL